MVNKDVYLGLFCFGTPISKSVHFLGDCLQNGSPYAIGSLSVCLSWGMELVLYRGHIV